MALINGLEVQWRVIHAIIMREIITRYGDAKIGFLWAFFEPLIHVGTFILIFSLIGREAPIGDNLATFILTGIIPWLMFTHIVFQVMSGVASNQALLSYPLVMPIDIAIARTILEFSTLALIFIVCLFIWGIVDADIDPENSLGMIAAILSMVVFAFGLGLINSAIGFSLGSYDRMFRNAIRPMYFMSGIFFTADTLPEGIQFVLAYNPMLHFIEWFRSDFYSNYNSNLLDKDYVLFVTLCLLCFGLIGERLTRKQARQL